jgi:hypothetical protein
MEFKYNETCPECDGWDLSLGEPRASETDPNLIYEFTVTCRNCFLEWLDNIGAEDITNP